jgi:hypothetical protein
LAAAYEGLDLVEFARAEVAGFGVRVDDRVGDDAHAVLPRNKRSPLKETGIRWVRGATGIADRRIILWQGPHPSRGAVTVLHGDAA